MFNKLLDPHEIAPSFTGTNVTKFSSMLTKAGNDSFWIKVAFCIVYDPF